MASRQASAEFCGSHFVDKMTKRGRDRFLKMEYKTNPDVQDWCDRMIVIRFDPPETMEATFNGLLEEARRNFNDGKSGKGKKGSLFRKCHSYWAYANRTFINGSHATVHELSCYHRPEDRSNQAIEASNKHKNMLIKEIAQDREVSGEHWLQLS